MDDTSPDITKKVIELFQQKTPFERLKMGCEMYETSKYLVTRAILEQEPGISEVNFRKEFFLKFYGDDFGLIEREKILKHLEACHTKTSTSS